MSLDITGIDTLKLKTELGHDVYNVKYKKQNESVYTCIDVKEEQFDKAIRYLKTDISLLNSTVLSLKKSGFSEIAVKQIIEIVYRYNNPTCFFNAIKNKLTVEEFLSTKDILQLIVSKYNLQYDLVVDLLRYAPQTQPTTGRGEAFIILFVEGAKKGKVGDIEINNEDFEIKGSDARIVGQRGFGDIHSAVKSFIKDIRDIDYNIDFNNANFSISVKKNGFIDSVAKKLTKLENISKNNIANIYVNGLSKIYINASDDDFLQWILPCLDNNGNILPNFKKQYFLFALKYYAQQENFSYLVSIGTSLNPKKRFGKMSVISANEIMNKSLSIFDKLSPDSYPSFLKSAGSQGPFFSIKPVV